MTRSGGPRRAALGVLLLAGTAFAEGPVLKHASPAAAVPGRTTRMVFLGENLSSASGLWTSFPCQAVLGSGPEGPGPDRAVFLLAVPEAVPPGVGAVRLVGSRGASSPFLVLLDTLPPAAGEGEGAPGDSRDLRPPVAIEGAVAENSADRHPLAALEGPVWIEVVARRLGSPLDPLLRVLDLEGGEAAYQDDAPGMGGDCRLLFSPPRPGRFVVEVRDALHAGGRDHRYRLRVGLPPLPPCAAAPAVPSSALEVRESEPNDSAAEASALGCPAVAHGRLERPGDRDYFRLPVRKGERLRVRALARALGSPGDLYVALERADGSLLAQPDLSGPDEGTLDHTFAEEGTFFLRVEELNRGGGPEHAYRLEVEPYRPWFTLELSTETLEAPPGGSALLEVTCSRRGETGPIALALEGEVAGLSLEGGRIEKGKESTQLKLTLSPSAKPGELRHFQVVGRSEAQSGGFETRASTMAALRRTLGSGACLPPGLEGRVALGVRE